MMGVKTLLPLGLLWAVVLARHHKHLIPGAPYNISTNDASLKPVLLDAAYFFNNQSNDAFFFRVSSVLGAQCQVVKGLKFLVDLDLSRTVCFKRRPVNLNSCHFQPAGPLKQVLRCHFDLWMIPWLHKVQNRVLSCT